MRRSRSGRIAAGAAAVAAALAAAPGAGTATSPGLSAALPRPGDVSLVRFVVVVGGGGAPRPTLARGLAKGVGVFAWVGRDASDKRRFDVLVALVNPLAGGARGAVSVSLGRGAWRVTATKTVANVVEPGRSLVCDDVYDVRSAPVALARGTVQQSPLKTFAAACALAADGPAPFDFVRSFGGFYCSTSFVNDPSILRGPRWATSCTKPFASAQLTVGGGYDLQGADDVSGARCAASGQTLTCTAPSEQPSLDGVLLLRPVPGDSPSGTATIRRADGEHVTSVDVVRYPGEHQHG